MEGKGGGSTQSFRPLMEEVMVGYSKKKNGFLPYDLHFIIFLFNVCIINRIA